MHKADVVKFFGSAHLAAIALDIARVYWYDLPDPLPKRYACELEVITAGGLRVDWSLYPRKRPMPERMPKPAPLRRRA